jgi:hypothetical protein
MWNECSHRYAFHLHSQQSQSSRAVSIWLARRHTNRQRLKKRTPRPARMKRKAKTNEEVDEVCHPHPTDTSHRLPALKDRAQRVHVQRIW